MERRRSSKTKPDNSMPLVSLDGGKTFKPAASGVRVIYQDQMIPDEDGRGELHINLTSEGVIMDVWTTRNEPLDHNIATNSEMANKIVDRLVNQDV